MLCVAALALGHVRVKGREVTFPPALRLGFLPVLGGGDWRLLLAIGAARYANVVALGAGRVPLRAARAFPLLHGGLPRRIAR